MTRIADLIAEDPDDLFPGCPSKDTVHRIIGSGEFPAQQANVVSVAAVLAREARWDVTDAVERVRSAWVTALLAEPLGKSLTELDPYALEVHQSINVPGDKPAPLLPIYVPRDHDRCVREKVNLAVSGQNVLVALVGESSTGKTRTFWEAIQHLPPKWRLWQALDSAPHSDLTADLEKIGPHTVVWLNEAQRFLLTADPAEGEQLAAALRRIMHSPERRPVLILVTLWPKYWDQLTSEPHDGQRDLHPHARHVLDGTSVRVPVTFEPKDLENLKEASAVDARLAQAMEHAEQRQVTQYLAGVPALIQRYQTAAPSVRALIDAAMDIRRIGYGEHMPLELLEAAAYEYLTDLQFDLLPEDWLEAALAQTAQPQRGIRGPLTRARPRSKGSAKEPVRYRLADPLDQLGREERRRLFPPAGLWDLLAHHSTPTDALSIGESAEYRCLFHTAATFYKKAADSGSSEAALRIAEILSMTARKEETIEWYEAAHSLGDPKALNFAAQTLATHEDPDWESAKEYYMRAAYRGDIFALTDCRDQMRESEYEGDEEEWLEKALTDVLDRVSIESAVAWYEQFGNEHNLGRILLLSGQHTRGIRTLERSTLAGNFFSMYQVCQEKQKSGGIESALSYLKDLGASKHIGSHFAPMALKKLMISAGRQEECAALLKEMIKNGNASAVSEYSELMRRTGNSDDVINFLYSLPESSAQVSCDLAQLLHQESRNEEAISLLTPLADSGNNRSQYELARILESNGRFKEALAYYQKSAEDGTHNAATGAVRILLRAKQATEALEWLRFVSHPDAKHDWLDCAVWVLESMGRNEEAKRLRDYGWEPDGTISSPWSIHPSMPREA
ncbi:hypothetical protein R6V09_14235 [Streptomyces sp. W16]|uniref:tetratricopeptide repeat protein n=1 Tax=Streptomyces sp. W16 TaxID=3076631 RepID=UPI00295AC2D4|nr:hypothetical protein [Streptomyces sp. W16]MDV9171274.1 hypothetical protein [Streptomyces sp. W16]